MSTRRPLPIFLRYLAALALTLGAAAQAPVEPLEGLDPVLLVEGKEVDGDPAITFDRRGFRYSFASAETRDRFTAAPERYEIAQHGFCARMGAPTVGNPQLFHVHGGKIYLFGSGECHRRFVADPAKYLEPEPPATLTNSASPKALAAGRALLEQVKQSLGGTALDELASLRWTIAPSGEGSAARPESFHIIRFPDRFRYEDERSFGRAVQVVTAERVALGLAGRAPLELDAEQGREVLRIYQRNLWSVLKAQGNAGLVAARPPTPEGSPPKLEVEVDGQVFTLTVDGATLRVTSLSYRGRNPDGELGELFETFSDYRAVAGLWLPFATAATWNGVPQPGRSFVVKAAEVNPELPADTFRWPVAAAAP